MHLYCEFENYTTYVDYIFADMLLKHDQEHTDHSGCKSFKYLSQKSAVSLLLA